MNKVLRFLKKKKVKNFMMLNIGVFLVAISYSCFQHPNNIVAGGVGGVATILNNTLFPNISPSVFILIFDVFFLVLGLIFLGKDFFKKTCYGTLIYPVYTFLSELIYKLIGSPLFTGEELLCVVVASVITGLGIGLSMKAGGSTGGFDVPQLMITKYCHIPMTVSLALTDGLVVVLSGLVMTHSFIFIILGVIFIIVSGKVIEGVTLGGLNSQALYICSEKNNEIKRVIIEKFERTVTEIYSRGGYHEKDKMMLLCILSTREYNRLIPMIKEIDPKVFIFVSSAKEVHGEGFSFDTFHE